MLALMRLQPYFLFSLYSKLKGNRFLHETMMKIAIVLSLLFLVMYVAYHMTSDPTPFGGKDLFNTFITLY